MKESEVIFVVEESNEGGFEAKALGHSIFTEAEDLESLKVNIKDAVKCHFEDKETPSIIRLHFVREELLAV
ncbi:MAG: 2-oxoisovalerate dehydrogenase [Ignavibacteria bacterium]